MRYATGGIGIDKVSFTLTSINVYGNDKFAAWTKGGVVISKVLHPGDGQMTLVLTKGIKRKPNEAATGKHLWSQPRGPMTRALPAFGLTDPVGIAIVDGKLNIIIPEKAKRAKLLRGHDKKTKASVSRPDTAPPPPPGHDNTIRKVMSDVHNGAELPRPTPLYSDEETATFRRFQAVSTHTKALNQLAREMGGELVFEVSDLGILRSGLRFQ